MPRLILAFALVLFWASRSLAWGPYTHAALSESLLERIADARSHPLAFLVQEPYRAIFVRSSLSPDMTLSAFAARKVDPVYNKLFHDKVIGRALVQSAWDRQDWKTAAFGLGWLGHAAADNCMSRAGGSVIYKDLFGLPRATRRKLAVALNAINKVSLDAFVLTEYEVDQVTPYIQEVALAAALKGPIQQRKLSVEAPEDALPGFARSFEWACSSLHAYCSQVGETRAFPALIAELTEENEEGRTIPGFDDAIDAMEEVLLGAVASRLSAPRSKSDLDQAKDAAGGSPGIGTRAVRKAKALAASGTGFLWGGTSITRKLRQTLLERSLQLVNAMGGDGSLGGRVLITFAGDMLNETRSWPEVRAHIQKLVAPAP